MNAFGLTFFRSITVLLNCFRYIRFSAELPGYASVFVTGRTYQPADCGFIGKAVFRQRSSHTERYLLRRYFRKPLLLVVGQSDGFCPKCAKLRCIGNYIIKTENQVALRHLPRRSVSEPE